MESPLIPSAIASQNIWYRDDKIEITNSQIVVLSKQNKSKIYVLPNIGSIEVKHLIPPYVMPLQVTFLGFLLILGGLNSGDPQLMRILLAIGLPLIALGIWSRFGRKKRYGLVDRLETVGNSILATT